MSNQWASPIYTDGDWTTAKPVSLPVFIAPIPGVNTKYVFTQDWMVALSSYSAASIGAAHYSTGLTPDYSAYKLMNEGELRDMGGGMVRWTRTYATVPALHNEWENFVYSFIGFTQLLTSGVYQTRGRQNDRVQSRIQHDYFIADGSTQSDPILGGSKAISSAGDINQVLGMVYVSQGTVGGAAIVGGITLAVDSLNVQGVVLPTWPTSDQYLTMIADALHNGWGATVSKVVVYDTTTLSGTPPTTGHSAGAIITGSSTLGGQIPAENSVVDRWMGNIWVRRTRFLLAK